MPAIPLGAYVLLARKGDARHKQLGKIWLALMLLTAFSAIFITSGGGYGPIHVFIPLTIFSAWRSVATARRGNIPAHKRQLVFTYVTGLVFPGPRGLPAARAADERDAFRLNPAQSP